MSNFISINKLRKHTRTKREVDPNGEMWLKIEPRHRVIRFSRTISINYKLVDVQFDPDLLIFKLIVEKCFDKERKPTTRYLCAELLRLLNLDCKSSSTITLHVSENDDCLYSDSFAIV